jgi:flagellar FliJ protein
MKRFVFRLATLLRVKESLEKEQKAKLMEIRERLRRLEDELAAMRARQAELSEMYAKETRTGITGDRMQSYMFYFDHMRDTIVEQNERIREADEERLRRQDALLRTMKEIKTLNKLKETQYAEYLEEVAKEEEKAIGDIVSFKVTVGEGLAL